MPSSRSSTSTTSESRSSGASSGRPVAAIVERPLAAVIARESRPGPPARRSRGRDGRRDGAAVRQRRPRLGDPRRRRRPGLVHRVTIGFQGGLGAGGRKVDAATAFWNAEGVTLRRMGVPTREFRVDRYGAPRYPELILSTDLEADRIRPSPGSVGRRSDPSAVTPSPSSDRDWHWAPSSTARRASIAPRNMPSSPRFSVPMRSAPARPRLH